MKSEISEFAGVLKNLKGAIMKDRFEEIRENLDSLKIYDIHSHLGSYGFWQAEGLTHILKYHWLLIEFERVSREIIDQNADDETFMEKVCPLFPFVINTTNHYALMNMLKDLYGVTDRTITAQNWRSIDEIIREKRKNNNWIHEVLDKAKIKKVNISIREFQNNTPRDRFVPYEYGESLYACHTLNDDFSNLPLTVDELEKKIRNQVDNMVKDNGVRAIHLWIPNEWIYQEKISKEKIEDILLKIKYLQNINRTDCYELMSFCGDICSNQAAKHNVVVQLFHGMTHYEYPCSVSTVAAWNQKYLPALTHHIFKNSNTTFDLFLATRYPSHEIASIARVYHNLMVSGAWWHGFTPSTLCEFFRDRLEMLPNNTWNAFYSDGYIIEWIYAKLLITKNSLAKVLTEMVNEGYLTVKDTSIIASRLLYENALNTYGG